MCVVLKRTFVSFLAGNSVCLMWLQRFRSSKEKCCDSFRAYKEGVLTDLDPLCMASHSLQAWKTRHETRWEIVTWCLTGSIFQALMNFCWPFWHRLSSIPLTLQRAMLFWWADSDYQIPVMYQDKQGERTKMEGSVNCLMPQYCLVLGLLVCKSQWYMKYTKCTDKP